MKFITAVFVTLSFLSQSALAENLNYTSYDTKDHQAIFNNNWKINSYKAKANFIKAESESADLVIFSPGWGGSGKYESAFKDIAAKLSKKHHYLYLSHPKSIDLAARTISIFQAIKAVKKIAAVNKTIIIGASGGAQEGLHTTHIKTADALAEGNSIDAVVGFYPSCRSVFSDNAFYKTKTIMFLGGKDKTAPAKLCHDLKNNANLVNSQIIDYPKAGHSWLFRKSEKYSQSRTWQDCTLTIEESGVWTHKELNSLNGIDSFLDGMSEKCNAKVKLLSGRNNTAYKQSIDAAVKFINSL